MPALFWQAGGPVDVLAYALYVRSVGWNGIRWLQWDMLIAYRLFCVVLLVVWWISECGGGRWSDVWSSRNLDDLAA
jgi:hypothetical protein